MESTIVAADKAHHASATAPHASGPQYEFSENENEVIGGLASRMHVVGLFTLGIGVFVILLGAILFNVASVLSGTLYAVIGLWTDRASVSFRKISDSQGRDLSHLMRALRDLRNLYSLQVWICTFTMASAVFGMAVLLLRARG